MDADLATAIRLKMTELATLAARAAERDDFESKWIHRLLTEELRNLERRLGPITLCQSCPPRVAAVCPRSPRK